MYRNYQQPLSLLFWGLTEEWLSKVVTSMKVRLEEAILQAGGNIKHVLASRKRPVEYFNINHGTFEAFTILSPFQGMAPRATL